MKKVFFGLLALAIVTFSLAFRVQPNTQELNEVPVWFILQPGGDPDNPSHYQLASGGQEGDCEGEQEVCAIKAVPDVNNNNLPRFDASKTYDQALIQAINQSQSGAQPDAEYVVERN